MGHFLFPQIAESFSEVSSWHGADELRRVAATWFRVESQVGGTNVVGGKAIHIANILLAIRTGDKVELDFPARGAYLTNGLTCKDQDGGGEQEEVHFTFNVKEMNQKLKAFHYGEMNLYMIGSRREVTKMQSLIYV